MHMNCLLITFAGYAVVQRQTQTHGAGRLEGEPNNKKITDKYLLASSENVDKVL